MSSSSSHFSYSSSVTSWRGTTFSYCALSRASLPHDGRFVPLCHRSLPSRFGDSGRTGSSLHCKARLDRAGVLSSKRGVLPDREGRARGTYDAVYSLPLRVAYCITFKSSTGALMAAKVLPREFFEESSGVCPGRYYGRSCEYLGFAWVCGASKNQYTGPRRHKKLTLFIHVGESHPPLLHRRIPLLLQLFAAAVQEWITSHSTILSI